MTYIYESPDSGETVYKRKIGSTDRTLHRVSKSVQDDAQLKLWKEILFASKHNIALANALEQAVVIYKLSLPND